MTYATVDEHGTEAKRAMKGFQVDVSGCRWRIRMDDRGQSLAVNDPKLYIEITNSLDGIYKRIVYDGERIQHGSDVAGRALTARHLKVLVTNVVVVSKGSVPFMGDWFATVPWLAYASACYFQTNHGGSIKQFLTMNETLFADDSVIVPVEITARPGSAQCLQKIKFFNEGFYYVPQPGTTANRHRLLPPFDTGFCEAVFEVKTSVSISDLEVAKQFSICYYGPKAGATSAEDTALIARIEGWATSVTTAIASPDQHESSAEPNMRPPPTSPSSTTSESWSYVIDERLSNRSGPATYFTRAAPYQLNDRRLKEKQQVALLRRKWAGQKPMFVTCILVVTAGLPLGVLGWRILRGKN